MRPRFCYTSFTLQLVCGISRQMRSDLTNTVRSDEERNLMFQLNDPMKMLLAIVILCSKNSKIGRAIWHLSLVLE